MKPVHNLFPVLFLLLAVGPAVAQEPPTRRRPPPRPARPQNFGIDTGELAGRERYLHNGKEVSRDEAFGLLHTGNGSKIPDDRDKLRVVVIGEDEQRKAVLDTFPPAWKDRVILHGYAPSHWHVSRYGYKTDGRPTIYVLAPGGAVLHRQDDYQGGPDGLAKALDQATRLRRAQPYDPTKDPDRRKALPALPRLPWSAWAVGGGALLVLFILAFRRPS